MQKQRGFTLIELLVVLAIAAILVSLAAPSFRRLIQSNSVANSVNTFMSDLRYARSESIRLGGGVVMCRSDAPEAAPPSCNTGLGPNNKGWISGWIVFQDLNKDGTHDANEPVLRVQSAIKTIDSVLESGGGSTPFKFTATGRLLNVSSTTQMTFGGSDIASDVQRVLCVSLGGRARIAGNGSASCGSNNE